MNSKLQKNKIGGGTMVFEWKSLVNGKMYAKISCFRKPSLVIWIIPNKTLNRTLPFRLWVSWYKNMGKKHWMFNSHVSIFLNFSFVDTHSSLKDIKSFSAIFIPLSCFNWTFTPSLKFCNAMQCDAICFSKLWISS